MVLPTIVLENKYHRGKHQILIQFNYSKALKEKVKAIPGTQWSARLKCWYILNTTTNLKVLKSILKDYVFIEENHLIDHNLIRQKHAHHKHQLAANHEAIVKGYKRYLTGKRYSESTIGTYTFLITDLVSYYDKKDLSTLTNRDIELYIEDVYIKRNYSISKQRQFISALKVFIMFYPEICINELALVRPKKSKILPTVLSKHEVINLIRCTRNLKHRAIIGLIYSCGLRISELINLELRDIDIQRKQLLIKNGKGRKDRYIILAESFLPILQNYLMTYEPKRYFVEGRKGGLYSAVSIRSFLKTSCRLAQIKKRVTPHTLRHSYATHLLENGIDIRYIQELLGHIKPETTMIYTHVSKKDLLQIESPLDVAIKDLLQNIKKRI